MRDRMERLVLLPFTMGCVSESSVAIGVHDHARNKKPDTPIIIRRKEEEDEEESSPSRTQTESALKFPTVLKPNVSPGVHRLLRSFKTLSQLFAYKEDMDEELEMEIGVPTDVKHVTHIGWSSDGVETTAPVPGWDDLLTPHLLMDATDHLIPRASSPEKR
ncbi:hypothetical protein K2173_026510 [Erythroxylum novogranatense]|uniref:CRIB domain-containing protein n=1 Tax=Erythroxylum novogranatense TaxID=1862640 RepID=A0AAV8U077_9ROSI|nr:hypothetical protein K2173_026510 [Erythroxylum novogranatense]